VPALGKPSLTPRQGAGHQRRAIGLAASASILPNSLAIAAGTQYQALPTTPNIHRPLGWQVNAQASPQPQIPQLSFRVKLQVLTAQAEGAGKRGHAFRAVIYLQGAQEPRRSCQPPLIAALNPAGPDPGNSPISGHTQCRKWSSAFRCTCRSQSTHSPLLAAPSPVHAACKSGGKLCKGITRWPSQGRA